MNCTIMNKLLYYFSLLFITLSLIVIFISIFKIELLINWDYLSYMHIIVFIMFFLSMFSISKKGLNKENLRGTKILNIAGYIDGDGSTIPLSRAAFIAERGGDVSKIPTAEMELFERAYKDGGRGTVESIKDVLRLFTNEGDILGTGLGTENLRIEGHNAEAFDLDKLIGTLQRLPAFQEDDEAKRLLKKFLHLRSSKSDYMLDTLDSAKIAIGMQQAELETIMQNAGSILGDDTFSITPELQRGLLSSFSISPEMFGGAKGTESLENLFLNTNFLNC